MKLKLFCLIACLVSPALTGCGLFQSEPVKSALDMVKEPAAELLSKIIRDRFGADVEIESSQCSEMPIGFQSGYEDLDDDERGAFIMCWGRAED